MEEPFISFHDDEGYYTEEEFVDFVLKNYCNESDLTKGSTEPIPSPYQFFL